MTKTLEHPTYEAVSEAYEKSLPSQEVTVELGKRGIVGSHMASEAIALDHYKVNATTVTASEERPVTFHNASKAFFFYDHYNGEALSHNAD